MYQRQEWLIKIVRPALINLLVKHAGNRTHVAQELGTHRRTVIRWIEYCGLSKLPFDILEKIAAS